MNQDIKPKDIPAALRRRPIYKVIDSLAPEPVGDGEGGPARTRGTGPDKTVRGEGDHELDFYGHESGVSDDEDLGRRADRGSDYRELSPNRLPHKRSIETGEKTGKERKYQLDMEREIGLGVEGFRSSFFDMRCGEEITATIRRNHDENGWFKFAVVEVA